MTQSFTRTARVVDLLDNGPHADRFERLYDILLANIPCSVLLVDSRLQVVSANQNFLTKARVTESDIIGQQLRDAFPPGICEHLHLHERICGVFHEGTTVQGERMVYRAPGLRTRTYYYSLVPCMNNGTIAYVMLLMEDVTEQIRLGQEARQAEQHLASVVESASDMVVSTDVAGRVLTWNTAAESVTGYAEKDVLHRYLYELATDAQRAALADILEKAPHESRTDPVEIEFACRLGGLVPISWVFSPMRDPDGRVLGLVAVGRDLTERRELEAKLRRSEKLAALGVMAGGIAHEVRNPLAIISSAAQLLVEKKLAPEIQRECAQSIFRATCKAGSIIEGLLRFARSSDQRLRAPLDLAPIVDEALALLADQLGLDRIKLVWRAPSHPIGVKGNAVLLQQLVTNLALNAVNAMADHGGTLSVSLAETEDQVVLEVADTGKGIPPADMQKVFDPFFTTMPIGKGTGLGLSISYAIVQEHEGRIDIASREGTGTTVSHARRLDAHRAYRRVGIALRPFRGAAADHGLPEPPDHRRHLQLLICQGAHGAQDRLDQPDQPQHGYPSGGQRRRPRAVSGGSEDTDVPVSHQCHSQTRPRARNLALPGRTAGVHRPGPGVKNRPVQLRIVTWCDHRRTDSIGSIDRIIRELYD